MKILVILKVILNLIIVHKNIYITKMDDYLGSSYSNYFIQVQSKIGKNVEKTKTFDDIESKLNKCYDLVNNNICIPYGEYSKTAAIIYKIQII